MLLIDRRIKMGSKTESRTLQPSKKKSRSVTGRPVNQPKTPLRMDLMELVQELEAHGTRGWTYRLMVLGTKDLKGLTLKHVKKLLAGDAG
jgi:hypothetical protein